jgi:TetR/AcrR family transcriptional repressor of nem operon
VTQSASRREETHRRILDAAGRLFRAGGIDGVGVDAVMRAANLTHGGFYQHFASKEALVAEVCADLLQGSAQRWQAAVAEAPAAEALRQIVDRYLDAERVASGGGCLLPTLGPDMARRPGARAALRAALETMLAALQDCLPGGGRDKAMAALATMVGAVTLARVADDPAVKEGFLRAARQELLAQADRDAG